MSLSFEILKEPTGWRLRTDRQIDLTNWSVEYSKNSIRCKPEALEFIWMTLGAIFFWGLAIFPLYLWSQLSNFEPKRSAKNTEQQPTTVGESSAVTQDPSRSKYEEDQAKLEDVRRATDQLLEQLLKDKTPEEREKFLAKMKENRKEAQDRYAPKKPPLGWLGPVFRIVAPLAMGGLVLIPTLLGSAFMVRMVRFFRDYLELSVSNQALILRRPKLFGGISERVLPLNRMISVTYYGYRRRHHRIGYRVHWVIAIASEETRNLFLQIEFNNFPGDSSITDPPENVLDMANGILKLTGTPRQNFPHPLNAD
ncbi:MAG: hypothetical protein ABL888_13055 [Pirellulaceae bacterium]